MITLLIANVAFGVGFTTPTDLCDTTGSYTSLMPPTPILTPNMISSIKNNDNPFFVEELNPLADSGDYFFYNMNNDCGNGCTVVSDPATTCSSTDSSSTCYKIQSETGFLSQEFYDYLSNALEGYNEYHYTVKVAITDTSDKIYCYDVIKTDDNIFFSIGSGTEMGASSIAFTLSPGNLFVNIGSLIPVDEYKNVYFFAALYENYQHSTKTFCSAIWDPVCTYGGITFSNECMAHASFQSVKHKGKCKVAHNSNAVDRNDVLLHYLSGDDIPAQTCGMVSQWCYSIGHEIEYICPQTCNYTASIFLDGVDQTRDYVFGYSDLDYTCQGCVINDLSPTEQYVMLFQCPESCKDTIVIDEAFCDSMQQRVPSDKKICTPEGKTYDSECTAAIHKDYDFRLIGETERCVRTTARKHKTKKKLGAGYIVLIVVASTLVVLGVAQCRRPKVSNIYQEAHF